MRHDPLRSTPRRRPQTTPVQRLRPRHRTRRDLRALRWDGLPPRLDVEGVLHCLAILPHVIDYWSDDGYTEADFVDWEPASIQEARWRAQYRRKWRRRDGRLYPVPGADAA
jgi:hypothetical protein